MKKYYKELLLLIIQLLTFYILPLSAGPTDGMGLVVLIIIITFILSIIFGIISKENIKYFYPLIVSLLFIPSVFIYYNDSAFVHAIWYLVISIIGLLLGIILKKIINLISKRIL